MKTHFRTISVILLSCFSILLASCSKTEIGDNKSKDIIFPSEFTIPIETALDDLSSVLRANPEITKSAVDLPAVSSVKTISFGVTTKAGTVDDSPKLYIASLSNGGNAILGADYRASGVLAIIDKGTITDEDFKKSSIYYTKSWSKEDYPKDDDLVLPVSEDEFPIFLASYFQEYIESKIDSYNPETKSSTINYGGKTWITDEYIPRLMNTVWGQWTPFNKTVDITHPGCPTGCVATALAQILNYCQYPNSIRTLTIDWDSNGNVYTYTGGVFNAGTNMEQVGVANLMLYIGSDVNMTYNTDGSSASDNDAVSALQYYGFPWVQKHTWANIGNNMDYYVKNCLRGYRPAYYSGTHKFNLFKWTGIILSQFKTGA